jgi:hypothetical protein
LRFILFLAVSILRLAFYAIEPEKVKRFIKALDDIGVKCFAIFLASSGLRKVKFSIMKRKT